MGNCCIEEASREPLVAKDGYGAVATNEPIANSGVGTYVAPNPLRTPIAGGAASSASGYAAYAAQQIDLKSMIDRIPLDSTCRFECLFSFTKNLGITLLSVLAGRWVRSGTSPLAPRYWPKKPTQTTLFIRLNLMTSYAHFPPFLSVCIRHVASACQCSCKYILPFLTALTYTQISRGHRTNRKRCQHGPIGRQVSQPR